MKSLVLTIGALCLMLVGAQAQVSYGLKAGLNLAKYSQPIEDELKDYEKSLPSFYVTGFADIPVAPNFSVQPGLSLQGKGAKYEGEVNGVKGSININVMSLEIPVNAVYYIPAGTGNVFLGAGPYIGFNLSGKVKSKVEGGEGAGEDTEDIKFSGDDKNMERIDAGLNFMLGYKLSNGFLINGGYNLGLTNLSTESDLKTSNRVFSVGIGFQF
ncbi:porin family protein [Sphingobacterium lactis]|uniref:porin family protein n=1 Tax=Sphingobacterium lactis TaxID=797291 RepID=UPI003F7E42E2